jgi:tetratricopeptide (TPR) repeat protein
MLLAMPYQGLCLIALGSFERAEHVLDEAVTMSRRLGVRFAELAAKLYLSAAVARRGQGLSALALLTEAQQSFAAMGNRLMEGFAQRGLAHGRLLMGDREGALTCAESAVELAAGAPPFQAEAFAMLAQVRSRRGEQAEALVAAQRAMAILDKLGSIGIGEAGARLVYVEALGAAGDDEGARSALEKARDRLAARAAKIRDPELRRSFLEEVRIHRKTLELARKCKWLSEGPDPISG